MTARTVDGARTIEAVEIKGAGFSSTCLPSYDCRPATPGWDAGPPAPCAEVHFISYASAGSSCEIRFISISGQSVTASATIRNKPGTGYSCPQGGVQYPTEFEPAVITIDFSQGAVDATSDGGAQD